LNGKTLSLRPVETDEMPEAARPAAQVIPMQLPRQAGRYGEGRKPNFVALAGSIAIVGGLIFSMLAFHVVTVHKAPSTMTLVDMVPEPAPPPPPPPPAPRPKQDVPQTASPVVAPKTIVETPPVAVQVATSPVPQLSPVAVPGPPTPAPPAPAPAVESVGDLSSKMISATPPRYPIESRRKHEQGVVSLMVVLSVEGTVVDISVAKSSGFERLDRAALSAVRTWRWSPTRRGGVPVMVRGVVEIPFILKS